MNFTHFHVMFLQHGCFHCTWPTGPKSSTTEHTRLDRVVIAKQCLKSLIQRKITFRTLFCHRIHVFPMIITVSTLLSLLHLISRFKLNVVKIRKLTLFSLGNIDQTSRSSVNVTIKHVFSMNFTHFHDVLLQNVCLHCNRPKRTRYANIESTRLDRVFMPKHCEYC